MISPSLAPTSLAMAPVDVNFPGLKARFAPPVEDCHHDSIIFESCISGSFFSIIIVDFDHKFIKVISEDVELRDNFRSYFMKHGISGDSIYLCSYTAIRKTDIQRLCRILLANNEFPVEWHPFFQSLARDGIWIISSKRDLSTSLASSSSSSSSSMAGSSSILSTTSSLIARASHILPEGTIFTNATGEIARYFFKNNPWKLSKDNNFQKIYRFCIICGTERFSSEKWSKVLSMWGCPPTICDKMTCYGGLEMIPAFVARRHYIIETDLDRSRIPVAQKQEFLEDIPPVTSFIRCDKIYRNESGMPRKYLETFKQLESLPVETRISKIDSIYFDYVEKNSVKVGKTLFDTSDPFLRLLAEYRQKSYKILDSLRSKI